MRTKTLRKNTINIVTLGCSKNLYDSEVLMGQLKKQGKTVVHQKQGNIVVINTCGFIENAKQESIDTILHYAKQKQGGLVDKVFVMGCLSERYKPELRKEIPDIDAYFGTRDLPAILKVLGADYKQELVGERLTTTPQHYAYLKISEGCDRKCSFCAIPLMRGRHVSKPIEQLVEEANQLALKGVKELILIAQDLTYYGLDLYKKRNLAELLSALVKVQGIHWIRLHYAFPAGFPEDVLDVMAKEPKICKYLDIPLQHISDDILKSMRRGTTYERTDRLLKTFKEKVPGIALRTTLIVGYPGETHEDFECLKNWVQEMKFDRLGCFTYSHEENTHAFHLEDNVPEEEKQRRAEAIMGLQQQISFAHNQCKIGETYLCLFDRIEGPYLVGRTQFDSPDVDNEVLVPLNTYQGKAQEVVGGFRMVKINEATDYDLIGDFI